MLNFETMSRPEKIAARRSIRENLDTLTAIYAESRFDGPAAVVARLVKEIGKPAAIDAVANLVNTTSAADGRISSAARIWAESIETAATPADLDRMHVYPSIHPSHICQLAEAARSL